MRSLRRWPVAALLATALLAACTTTPAPDSTPTPTPVPTATVTATATAMPSPSPTPEPTDTETCAPFGTEDASASSPDWAADLRADLWGADMRLGQHECYDRWVFEFAGGDDAPGWQATPHDTNTFPGDASGEPIDALSGTASLEILFAAWFDGTPIDEAPYTGPEVLYSKAGAILEARIVSGFEGITQVGLGLDRSRPYRVTWLEDPGRLVVDVYTG